MKRIEKLLSSFKKIKFSVEYEDYPKTYSLIEDLIFTLEDLYKENQSLEKEVLNLKKDIKKIEKEMSSNRYRKRFEK